MRRGAVRRRVGRRVTYVKSHDFRRRRALAGAPREIAHWSDYDYVIVNDDVERSVAGLVAIVAAERLRRTRQTGLGLLADGIIAELRQL